MSKHTKAPWLVEPPDEFSPDSRPVVRGGAKGTEPVCEILGPLDDEDGPHRGAADLALILAAPDLYEVVRKLAQTPWEKIHLRQLQEEAEAALSKAEGRQS